MTDRPRSSGLPRGNREGRVLDPIAEGVIDRIRAAMEREGLDGQGLAARARVHPTMVTKLLSGRAKDPQWSTVYGVARALGLSAEELMTGAGPRVVVARDAATVDEHLGLAANHVAEAQRLLGEERLAQARAERPRKRDRRTPADRDALRDDERAVGVPTIHAGAPGADKRDRGAG